MSNTNGLLGCYLNLCVHLCVQSKQIGAGLNPVFAFFTPKIFV